KLAASEGENWQNQSDLATSYRRIGDVQKTSGQLTEAQVNYRQALTYTEALLAAKPQDALLQFQQSVLHLSLSQLKRQSGDSVAAAAHLQQARAWLERQPAQADAAGLGQNELDEDAQRWLGSLLRESGDLAGALQHFHRSLRLTQEKPLHGKESLI